MVIQSRDLRRHYHTYFYWKENGTCITCESSLCRVIHAINLKISAALGPRTPRLSRRQKTHSCNEIRACRALGDVQRSKTVIAPVIALSGITRVRLSSRELRWTTSRGKKKKKRKLEEFRRPMRYFIAVSKWREFVYLDYFYKYQPMGILN